MTDEPHNRHVRFGTASGGVWGEPVRVLTGLRRDPGRPCVPPRSPAPRRRRSIAVGAAGAAPGTSNWRCGTTSRCSRSRRTTSRSGSAPRRPGSWLKHAGHGDRAMRFRLRRRRQRRPRVRPDATSGSGSRAAWTSAARPDDTATVTLWSWSPLAGAMDLRHYDTTAHGLDLAYEDVQQGFSTPEGMVRSTEMRLWALRRHAVARHDRGAAVAALTAPPQLVAPPAWYHEAGVFGRWSLPDRSTPARAALEDAIEPGCRVLRRSGRPAAVVRVLALRRRHAHLRRRPAQLALRRGRIRLGQRGTRHGRHAVVQLPALRRPRRRSGWRAR